MLSKLCILTVLVHPHPSDIYLKVGFTGNVLERRGLVETNFRRPASSSAQIVTAIAISTARRQIREGKNERHKA